MPVAAVLGKKLVGLDELDDIARDHPREVEAILDPATGLEAAALELPQAGAIGPAELERAREVASPLVPYQGVGIGKPLTVTIETVYIGDYPDTQPFIPGENKGDVLVTSAHKAFQTFAGAPRAVHLLQPNADRRTFIRAKATTNGSQLVYYSPAVTDFSIELTVELSADTDIDKDLGPSLGKAVAAAGALPVFAPAAPVLVAAGAAIPIAVDAFAKLARPKIFYDQTVEINFGRPGVALTQPGAFVLYKDGDDEADFRARYTLGEGFELRDKTGKAYRDWRPYVVLSLDGTERPDLKDWEATAASAELVRRFHDPDQLIGDALDVMTRGLSLYNDVANKANAEREKAAAAAAPKGPEKDRHQALYEAFKKNIQDESIRKSVG